MDHETTDSIFSETIAPLVAGYFYLGGKLDQAAEHRARHISERLFVCGVVADLLMRAPHDRYATLLNAIYDVLRDPAIDPRVLPLFMDEALSSP